MAVQTAYKHGTFSWIELTTNEPEAAKRFYGPLFGWTFVDMPVAPGQTYSMVKLGDHDVAGIMKLSAEMRSAGVPPHWASYVSVDDVDETAKKVVANGGKLHKEPFDVMDLGRMAVVADPTGATLCLWTAKKHIGSGVRDEPGALVWNEEMTTDRALAAKFYAKTIGWETQDIDMGPVGTYTLCKVPGEKKDAAGLMQIGPDMKGVPPNWLPYVQVVDVDASLKKAVDLGAKTHVPPTDIPNIGRFAIIQDTTGAVLAIYKPAS